MKIIFLILGSLFLSSTGYTKALDPEKCHYDIEQYNNYENKRLDESDNRSVDEKLLEKILSKKGYVKLDPKRDKNMLLQVPHHTFILGVYPGSYFVIYHKIIAESILNLDNLLSGKNHSIKETDYYMKNHLMLIKEMVEYHEHIEIDKLSTSKLADIPDCHVNQSKILQTIVDRQNSLMEDYEFMEIIGSSYLTDSYRNALLTGPTCGQAKRAAWKSVAEHGFKKTECVEGAHLTSKDLGQCWGVVDTAVRYRLFCSHDPERLKAIDKKDLLQP